MKSGARKVAPALPAEDNLFPHHARELKRMRVDSIRLNKEERAAEEERKRLERVAEAERQRQENRAASLLNLASARGELAGFFGAYADGLFLNRATRTHRVVYEGRGHWKVMLDGLYSMHADHREMLVTELRTKGWEATYPNGSKSWITLHMLDAESEEEEAEAEVEKDEAPEESEEDEDEDDDEEEEDEEEEEDD